MHLFHRAATATAACLLLTCGLSACGKPAPPAPKEAAPVAPAAAAPAPANVVDQTRETLNQSSQTGMSRVTGQDR